MDNIADQFCEWYDQLDAETLANHVADWRSAVAGRAGAVCDAVERGEAIEWPSDVDTLAGQEALYVNLKGFDWAFRRLHPDWMGRAVPPVLAESRRCQRRHGRLTSGSVAGALVLKLSSPAPKGDRPQRLDEAFDYVQRATPEQCRGLERIVTREGLWLTPSEKVAGITIGCVAFIDSKDELDVTVVRRAGDRLYHIELKSQERWAFRRVTEVITALDESRVDLAVLPEMALTKDLLEHWQAELATRAVPSESRLRWVLAGTGNVAADDPPSNTAVLLDAKTGECIVEQPKQYRFDLDPQQQAGAYAFPAFGPPGGDTLYEDIQVARVLRLVELGAMRIAILICEDLGRLSDLLAKVHHNGVSHLLAPVFAKETRAWFWEQQAADAFSRVQGTVVTVVNSLVIARMNGAGGSIRASLIHSPWGHVIQQVEEACGQMRTVVRVGRPLEPLDDVAP